MRGFIVCMVSIRRDTYRAFAPVTWPSNYTTAPGAAVVSVTAGMGSDWALGEASGHWQGCWRDGLSEDVGLRSMRESMQQKLSLDKSSWERLWRWAGPEWEWWPDQLIVICLLGSNWQNGCNASVSAKTLKPKIGQQRLGGLSQISISSLRS